MPKGTTSAEQLLKLKKFFAKAIDPSQDKIQMQERKSRILKTSDIVQVRAPVRTMLTLTLINCGSRPFCPIIRSRCESTFCDGRSFTVSAHNPTRLSYICCLCVNLFKNWLCSHKCHFLPDVRVKYSEITSWRAMWLLKWTCRMGENAWTCDRGNESTCQRVNVWKCERVKLCPFLQQLIGASEWCRASGVIIFLM
jgi:hypothetical protein